jgi:hypothetical protein
MKTTDPRTDPRYMRNPNGYGYVRIDDYFKRQAQRALEDAERRKPTEPDPRWLAIQRAYFAAPIGQRGHRPTLFAIAENMDPPISDDTLLRRLNSLGISGARELHRRMGR